MAVEVMKVLVEWRGLGKIRGALSLGHEMTRSPRSQATLPAFQAPCSDISALAMSAAVNFNTGPAATIKNCTGNGRIDVLEGDSQQLTSATEFFQLEALNSVSHGLPMKHTALARDTALQLAHVQEAQGLGAT